VTKYNLISENSWRQAFKKFLDIQDFFFAVSPHAIAISYKMLLDITGRA
jgi:hypothetical protein